MTLDGLRNIYENEVAVVSNTDPNNLFGPQLPLRSNQAMYFCTSHDAQEILEVATAALNAPCTLEGAPPPLSVGIFAQGPIPSEDYAFGYNGVGGTYIYKTPDGPRPYVIACPTKGISQNIASTLVATWTGQSAMTTGQDSSGKIVLKWA